MGWKWLWRSSTAERLARTRRRRRVRLRSQCKRTIAPSLLSKMTQAHADITRPCSGQLWLSRCTSRHPMVAEYVQGVNGCCEWQAPGREWRCGWDGRHGRLDTEGAVELGAATCWLRCPRHARSNGCRRTPKCRWSRGFDCSMQMATEQAYWRAREHRRRKAPGRVETSRTQAETPSD